MLYRSGPYALLHLDSLHPQTPLEHVCRSEKNIIYILFVGENIKYYYMHSFSLVSITSLFFSHVTIFSFCWLTLVFAMSH
uniref:Uncharacterized protein n=1 Tax=Pyxicephalus adspersus TaxID=30357 RepID=A0AAV3AGT6_PYXAD|nr:TPA: hypothetical protein GDO54_011945 [Pyxicephalus adspersus]